MASSRAFSCWIKHESLSLYLPLGVPFGTLLAICLTLLSKQIITMKDSFWESKPAWHREGPWKAGEKGLICRVTAKNLLRVDLYSADYFWLQHCCIKLMHFSGEDFLVTFYSAEWTLTEAQIITAWERASRSWTIEESDVISSSASPTEQVRW